MIDTLRTDPELEKITKYIPKDEMVIYKVKVSSENESIIPIYIWDGFVLKEEDLLKIIREHENLNIIPVEKTFENKYAALSWVYQNILKYRNLTPQRKKYFVGKRYEAEKMSHGGFRGNQHSSSSDFIPKYERTRKKVANETETSESYVKNAYEFSRGVDSAESTAPGIKDLILSGSIKRRDGDIASIARATSKERQNLIDDLTRKKDSCKFCSKRCPLCSKH